MVDLYNISSNDKLVSLFDVTSIQCMVVMDDVDCMWDCVEAVN